MCLEQDRDLGFAGWSALIPETKLLNALNQGYELIWMHKKL